MSVERPCPNETVTFTCTVTANRMRWEILNVTQITLLNTAGLNEPMMPQPGYTVTLTAVNDTILTTILSVSRLAEDSRSITVSCIDLLPTRTIIGSTNVSLTGEFTV